MHTTPLLNYSTADFPEYLFLALFPEAAFVSSCSSSQIPSQGLTTGKVKKIITYVPYLPHGIKNQEYILPGIPP